jgi:monoamine oxidase
LTLLLGGAVALEACKRRPVAPTFEGRLLGQSADRGHKVRDHALPGPKRREKAKVVIVGAGAAGLSAAWALGRAGFTDFRVLELEDHFGGTSASGENGVSAYPWGAHYVPVPATENRALVTLFEELGVYEDAPDAQGHKVVREERLCRAPQERLFMAGTWTEGLWPQVGASAEDLRQKAEFEAEVARWVGWRDGQGRRAFTIPTAGCGGGPALDTLDRMSFAEWIAQRGWDSPRLRWYLEYGCRDDYGATLETTSAWAGLFYSAARVDKPGDHGEPFVTWPAGNGHIMKHLAAGLGPKLRTGVGVRSLAPKPGGVEVQAFDFARAEPFAIDAERVICALPRFVAQRLVAPWQTERPAFLDAFVYSSWVVANLTLKDRPEGHGFPLAWDNVLYDSKGLGYVVATQQSGRDYGPTVLTYYLPLLDASPKEERELLLGAEWKHWVDVILSDLTRAHPGLPGKIASIDVWRWGHAMVRPVPGLVRSGLLEKAREPVGGIHFANTDLSGVALFEEAQHWGVAAAEAVMSALGVPHRSLL